MGPIWRNETHAGYGTYAVRPLAYLSDADNLRLERLRQCRMLFAGKHQEYYLGELRTQFDFPEAEVNGSIIRPYLSLKMLRLMSFKSADLVFGEKAALSCSDEIKRMYLDQLAVRSKVHARFHAAAVQVSWAGAAAMLSLVWAGKTYLRNVMPEEIYPVGDPTPDDQYEAYRILRVANVGTAEQPVHLLLETLYLRGRNERRVWQLDRDGRKLREIALTEWPGPERDLLPVEVTGIAENQITWIPNETDDVAGVSDYDGLVQSQDAINSACTQIASVIGKHTDPFMAIPASAFDEEGRFRSKAKAIAVDSPDQVPQYVTWDAKLDAAFENRKFSLNGFCIESEMSQVLLGIKEGAAPDAAKKLRLEATNSLAKAKRKTLTLEPGIVRALEVTVMMDRDSRRASVAFVNVEPITAEMRDGLPIDEVEEAEIVAKYRGSGSMSLYDAVERRKRDPMATAEEVEEIERENAAAAAAAAPPIMMRGMETVGQDDGEEAPE